MTKKLLITMLIGIMGFLSSAQLSWAKEKESMALTIYNQNFGVVKDIRYIDIKKGISDFTCRDIAASIDPTSVRFVSLTDPEGTVILEQNYEYDLINSQKLMQKYIDREIIIDVGGIKKKAVLLSTQGGNIIRMDGEIYLNAPGRIILPELPEGLITKPTLLWKIDARKGANHLAKITYITNNINWKSDYTLISKENDTLLDLSGWVTIDNKSGMTYKDAKIKLMAGDVHRIQPERYARVQTEMRYQASRVGSPQFVEKGFAEYHLYTLQRPSTVKNSQIKQIELLNASDVKSEKIYIYRGALFSTYRGYSTDDPRYGTEVNKKVNVMLKFRNSKENNLGMSLPMGKIRVYKLDKDDDSLEFIGEDQIDHTPKDEDIELYIGDAFDIIGERKQLNFKKISHKVFEETFEIKLRNHKKEEGAVEVKVIENLYRYADWEIITTSHNFTKTDSRTVEYKVKVPRDGEVKITYTVRYNSQ
ncbi:MAG: hypothetical protein ABIK53_03955 [bacterium]